MTTQELLDDLPGYMRRDLTNLVSQEDPVIRDDITEDLRARYMLTREESQKKLRELLALVKSTQPKE